MAKKNQVASERMASAVVHLRRWQAGRMPGGKPHSLNIEEFEPEVREVLSSHGLEQQCPDCHGEGLLPDGEWVAWRRNHRFDAVESIKAGDCPQHPEWSHCHLCNGGGVVPTDFGVVLIQFFYRHLATECDGQEREDA